MASKEIEMKDTDAASDGHSDTSALIKEIELAFPLLEKTAAHFDNRYVSKVFRDLGPLRRKLAVNHEALAFIVSASYPDSHPHKEYLLQYVEGPSNMETDSSPKPTDVLPEVNLYVHLLVQVLLLDKGDLARANAFNSKVVALLGGYNRRSLDFIQAKVWFYVSRTHELLGDLHDVRPALLSALRTATLRHDAETTAQLITLLLRNYLLAHDVNQALNLVEKTEFPENCGNALVARYYYYLAKVSAIQLDYSSAHEYVIAAIRKAPQTHLATGFVQAATKLSIVIDLLMGDIPELKTFKNGELKPYFAVTHAVKQGDLNLFGDVVKQYEADFFQDDLYTLVSRLRQNVIKTGIRIISLSYLKISLKDICIKLHLDSEEATEYIVSKAIRDGVIDATINHEAGYMQSKELLDVYSTKLPQEDYDQRIRFCLSLHNDLVKSMRYLSDNSKLDANKSLLESKEEELDLLAALVDGDLDDLMD